MLRRAEEDDIIRGCAFIWGYIDDDEYADALLLPDAISLSPRIFCKRWGSWAFIYDDMIIYLLWRREMSFVCRDARFKHTPGRPEGIATIARRHAAYTRFSSFDCHIISLQRFYFEPDIACKRVTGIPAARLRYHATMRFRRAQEIYRFSEEEGRYQFDGLIIWRLGFITQPRGFVVLMRVWWAIGCFSA